MKEREHDVATLTLVPSSGGVFEVECDGRALFSKKETGRFPEHPEILGQL